MMRVGHQAGRHSRILLGVLGGLLRALGVYLVLSEPTLLQGVAGVLSEAPRVAAERGLDNLEAVLATRLPGLVGARGLVVLVAALAAWLLGVRLVSRAWRSLTSLWRRRTRLILLAVNIISTILWVLALIVLLSPLLTWMASRLPYLETLIHVARRLDAALLAFTLASLTPSIAALLNLRESRGRSGRWGSLLLAVGTLLYALSALTLYLAWRGVLLDLASRGVRLGPSILSNQVLIGEVLGGLGRLVSMLSMLLRLVLLGAILESMGFLAVWLDYWRASRGT